MRSLSPLTTSQHRLLTSQSQPRLSHTSQRRKSQQPSRTSQLQRSHTNQLQRSQPRRSQLRRNLTNHLQHRISLNQPNHMAVVANQYSTNQMLSARGKPTTVTQATLVTAPVTKTSVT